MAEHSVARNLSLFPPADDECVRLSDLDRRWAAQTIIDAHYTHSVPSGKSRYYAFRDALIVFAIPANQHIGKFLLGREGVCWELARLWAPDGHERNLLTQAMSATCAALHQDEPEIDVLVSYADPNVGHSGGIYRAASWIYTGQVEDTRYYIDAADHVVPRRKFHSGRGFTRLAGILALGYRQVLRPGRHRFAHGLNRHARKLLQQRFGIRRAGSSTHNSLR